MLRNILISSAAIGLMSTPAMAEDKDLDAEVQVETTLTVDTTTEAANAEAPKVLTDEQMDAVVGGLNIVTRSGKLVWTVTNTDPLEGTNNGGYDATANAAGGLLTAAANGGLALTE